MQDADTYKEVQTEFDLLQKLGDSKYFVKAYELRIEPDRILIVMEYMPGGTLKEEMKKSPNGCFPEAKAAFFTAQLLRGVEFMHEKNIMNRDLKPQNILLDRTGQYLKISDFGFGKILSNARTHAQTRCGSPAYMAPELNDYNDRRPFYGRKTELWSVGIIIVEMLMGDPPYPQIFDNGVLQYRLPSHASEYMRDLVAKLLARDPNARPSASQAIQHEVFRYKGQQYTGKKLWCSNDDLDGIIKMALDNKLCIYAVVPKSVITPVFAQDAIVATSAITKFITTAKRGDLSVLLWQVHIIVSHSSSECPGHDYSFTDRNGKVKIRYLYFHIKDAFDPSTLSTIVKHMAANVCVTYHLSLSSSQSQPIANCVRQSDIWMGVWSGSI